MTTSNATLDSTGKRKGFRRLFIRFSEKTSMQGVSYINMAKMWWTKIIWTVLLLGAVAVMFLHLWYLFDQWYSFPKTTTIALGFDTLPLPQVTVCNTNIMHKGRLDRFEGATNLQQLVNDLLPNNLVPDQFDDNYEVVTTQGPEQTTRTSNTRSSTTGSGGVTTQNAQRTNRTRSTRSSTTGSGGVTTQGPQQTTRTSNTRSSATGSGGVTTRNAQRTNRTRSTRSSTTSIPRRDQNVRKKRELGSYANLNISQYIENLYQEETEDGDFDSELDDFTLLQKAFVDLYMDVKKKDRASLGHQIDDMLVGCTFNGKRCSQKMFRLHQTSEYGNCWAISSDGFKVRNAGPTGGLSLVLFLETNEYIRGITTGFGTRVVVQERNTYPFPAHEGMFIPASMETDIGLKMISVTRLGGKYGSCDDGEDFENSHTFKYTRRACQAFCEVSTVINTCSCFDDHSEEFALIKNKTLKPCRSKEEVQCLGRIRRAISRQTFDCNCDIPCSETSYRKTISSRQWPSDEYARVLLDWVCKRDTATCANLRKKLSNMRDLSNNFLKLNIYYEDLNFENITETAQIELQQFLSDIGGAFGLWIGLSILSLCELLQLFVELIAYTVRKPRTHRRQGEHEHEKEDSNHDKDNDDEPKDDRSHRKEHNSHDKRLNERNVHNDGFAHYRPFEQPHRHDQHSHGRRDPNEADLTNRSREHPRHHGPHGDRYGAPKWHGQLYK